MQAKAILFTDVNRAALDSIDVPAPAAGQVLIESAITMISPGTELRCLAGKQPNSAAWPFIPGYALAGTVIEVGAGVTLPIGSRVLIGGTIAASRSIQWGGHVSHAIQTEGKAIPIPDNVDFRDAAMTALAGIAYHGVQLSCPQADELIAVVGLGVLGQLSARLHALSGARVIGIDRIPARVAALEAGIAGLVAGDDPAAQFRGLTGRGADLVVDVTGAAAAIDLTITLAKDLPWTDDPLIGARVLIQGSYADRFAIPYQAAFEKQITFLVTRDVQATDKRAVLDLISSGKLAVRDLISAVKSPAEADEAYRLLREDPNQYLTIAFDWSRVR